MDVGCLEYLTRLASIYDINSYELLDSFVEAEKRKIATCGPLKITRREKAQDYGIFLVTNDSKVVAQLRLENKVWENVNQAKELCSLIVKDHQHFRKIPKRQSSIKDLRQGMKNVNLRVTVTNKSEIVNKNSRYDGKALQLCIAIVADSSGSIRLPLWNNQINTISIGDKIDIKNASVKRFQGLLQIVPARKGDQLTVISDPDTL
ncbi:hypothetical protein [[Eubacterium] cellulosolvens]